MSSFCARQTGVNKITRVRASEAGTWSRSRDYIPTYMCSEALELRSPYRREKYGPGEDNCGAWSGRGVRIHGKLVYAVSTMVERMLSWRCHELSSHICWGI